MNWINGTQCSLKIRMFEVEALQHFMLIFKRLFCNWWQDYLFHGLYIVAWIRQNTLHNHDGCACGAMCSSNSNRSFEWCQQHLRYIVQHKLKKNGFGVLSVAVKPLLWHCYSCCLLNWWYRMCSCSLSISCYVYFEHFLAL